MTRLFEWTWCCKLSRKLGWREIWMPLDTMPAGREQNSFPRWNTEISTGIYSTVHECAKERLIRETKSLLESAPEALGRLLGRWLRRLVGIWPSWKRSRARRDPSSSVSERAPTGRCSSTAPWTSWRWGRGTFWTRPWRRAPFCWRPSRRAYDWRSPAKPLVVLWLRKKVIERNFTATRIVGWHRKILVTSPSPLTYIIQLPTNIATAIIFDFKNGTDAAITSRTSKN